MSRGAEKPVSKPEQADKRPKTAIGTMTRAQGPSAQRRACRQFVRAASSAVTCDTISKETAAGTPILDRSSIVMVPIGVSVLNLAVTLEQVLQGNALCFELIPRHEHLMLDVYECRNVAHVLS